MMDALEISLKDQALNKMLVEMNKHHSASIDQIHNWLCMQDDEALLTGILAKEKTITKSFAYCTDKARKLAENSVAMIEDTTVYGWVKEYFMTPDLEVDKPKTGYKHKKVEVSNEIRNKSEATRDVVKQKATIKSAKKVGEQLDLF